MRGGRVCAAEKRRLQLGARDEEVEGEEKRKAQSGCAVEADGGRTVVLPGRPDVSVLVATRPSKTRLVLVVLATSEKGLLSSASTCFRGNIEE